MYLLKFGKRFDREYKKLDKSISDQINKKLKNLEENPKNGKPLLYTKPTLWQIKAEMYRIFYVIEDNQVIVLSVKHKDECDNYIKRDYIKDFLDGVSS